MPKREAFFVGDIKRVYSAIKGEPRRKVEHADAFSQNSAGMWFQGNGVENWSASKIIELRKLKRKQNLTRRMNLTALGPRCRMPAA